MNLLSLTQQDVTKPRRILLVEWMTFSSRQPVTNADNLSRLRREGQDMVCGFARQLALDAGYEVTVASGPSLHAEAFSQVKVLEVDRQGIPAGADPDRSALLDQLTYVCQAFDDVFVIAPEDFGIAAACAIAVERSSARLLSVDSGLIQLCSDKLILQRHLARAVSTPASVKKCSGWLVSKPRRAAGSRVRILPADSQPNNLPRELVSPETARRDATHSSLEDELVEPFIPGLAASVSVVCGPQATLFLPATEQLFANSDVQPGSGLRQRGGYVGSRPIQSPSLLSRAAHLARAAVKSLPEFRGYIGIDLILADTGAESDVVLEINPRLTSSFLLHQQEQTFNLAAVILKLAAGNSWEQAVTIQHRFENS